MKKKLINLEIFQIFGYMLEPNREFWQLFKKKKNCQNMATRENQKTT